MNNQPPNNQPPNNQPADQPPLDARDWDKAAEEFNRASLERARTSCEKWGGTIATLLGVFGTVAVVAGPKEIEKVSDQTIRWWIVGLVIAAASLAIWAVVEAAIGQGGSFLRKRYTPWNGTMYRVYIKRATATAAGHLLRSRIAAILAAFAVAAAGILTLTSTVVELGRAGTNPSQVMVITSDGRLLFGDLKNNNGSVTVGGQGVKSVSQAVLLNAGD